MIKEIVEAADTKSGRGMDPVIELYFSTLTDYIYKITAATVLFFISYPWAAFYWPPYYFIRRRLD